MGQISERGFHGGQRPEDAEKIAAAPFHAVKIQGQGFPAQIVLPETGPVEKGRLLPEEVVQGQYLGKMPRVV